MCQSRNKIILLVEDDIILSMAEKKMLEKLGYKVIVTHTGEEAIDSFKKNNGINLVLMDIDLGKGIDGTEAAEIILSCRYVPVVFFIEPYRIRNCRKNRKNNLLRLRRKGLGNYRH